MSKMNGKIKEWYRDNKDDIKQKAVIVGCTTAGLSVGWILGRKYSSTVFGINMFTANADGVLKFFNPETGLEMNIMEFADFISK